MSIKKRVLKLFPCISCAKVRHTYIKGINEFENLYKTRKVFSVLIDTRKIQAYNKKHIEYAINMEFSKISDLENFNQIKNKYSYIPSNWILFLYADDEKSTKKLKKVLKNIFREKYFWECPSHVYYLRDGYTS